MALSILFTLTCVLLSINADADICGIPKIKPIFHSRLNNDELGQIVDGYEAVPHSFPWMVSIHIDTFLRCGGSIIGKKWILTAAHCMLDNMYEEKDNFTITVGLNVQSESQNKTLMYNISRYYEPGYNPLNFNKDIVLIELTREITFSDHVMPICLPEQDDSATQKLIATGWGDTHSTGSDTNLRQVELTLISNEQCNNHTEMQKLGFLNDKMICTQETRGFYGTCHGDGGGPLMSNDSEFTKIKKDDTKPWVLYGLTSWGLLGCANRRKPHVYTKVSHFVNWIHAIIRD